MCENCEALRTIVRDLETQLGQRVALNEVEALRSEFGVTTAQARILMILLRANGRPVNYYELANAVCGPNVRDGYSTVKVHISRIRKQIGFALIDLAYGEGYYLTPFGLSRVGSVCKDSLEITRPPPEVAELLPANDEPSAMSMAVAIIMGRLANLTGVAYARRIIANVAAALDKQYGPAS